MSRPDAYEKYKTGVIKIKKTTLAKILVVVAIAMLYFFVPSVNRTTKEFASVLSSLDLDRIKEYILSYGAWAPIISFVLMVFQSVAAPLPAFLITFANAALFGWKWGALLSWSSAMVGALLCFYIARVFGRETVEKLASKTAIKEVDGFFERYGRYAVLIARLLPFVSFDFVSYAAGLTGMGLFSFLWATGLGQLPATLVYSYVGGMLTGGAKLFVTGLLILFSLSALIFLIKRVYNDRAKNSEKGAAK